MMVNPSHHTVRAAYRRLIRFEGYKVYTYDLDSTLLKEHTRRAGVVSRKR